MERDHGVFAGNHAFKSTSAGAPVLAGRSAHGLIECKTEDRRYEASEQTFSGS